MILQEYADKSKQQIELKNRINKNQAHIRKLEEDNDKLEYSVRQYDAELRRELPSVVAFATSQVKRFMRNILNMGCEGYDLAFVRSVEEEYNVVQHEEEFMVGLEEDRILYRMYTNDKLLIVPFKFIEKPDEYNFDRVARVRKCVKDKERQVEVLKLELKQMYGVIV